jgi:hypothetical protein
MSRRKGEKSEEFGQEEMTRAYHLPKQHNRNVSVYLQVSE